MTKLVRTSIQLEPEQLEDIKLIAKANDRSVSYTIREIIIRQFLESTIIQDQLRLLKE